MRTSCRSEAGIASTVSSAWRASAPVTPPIASYAFVESWWKWRSRSSHRRAAVNEIRATAAGAPATASTIRAGSVASSNS